MPEFVIWKNERYRIEGISPVSKTYLYKNGNKHIVATESRKILITYERYRPSDTSVTLTEEHAEPMTVVAGK